MISLLTGNLISVKDGVALLDVNGVGYDIFVNEPDCVGTVPRQSFYTHCHCPQDSAMQLFGFRTVDCRKLFRKLLDIEGVGPKMAMRVTGVRPELTDVRALCAIRGVGQKIAGRIAEVFSPAGPAKGTP